jgi:nitroreductase
MEFTTPVSALIRQRRSVRNYDKKSIGPEHMEHIREVLAAYSRGPMGNRVKFHFISRKVEGDGEGVRLGTYGLIKGAAYFIAGEMEPGPFAEEDYGFLMEHIMLHMLDMELGTCWLGGTFKRSEIGQIIGSSGTSIIPAITPLGYPARSMSRRERLIRKSVGCDNRKSWEELFFEGDPVTALPQDEDAEYALPLALVRLGPSASNKQPWRVVRKGPDYHFYLWRPQGQGKKKKVDLQRIDMGIAMAHFELGSREAGLKGTWLYSDHIPHPAQGMEYIISWQRK